MRTRVGIIHTMTRPNQPTDIFLRIAERGPDDCWPWKGRLTYHGYGEFDINGQSVKAHRFVYEFHFGLVPPGLEVLHICGNRDCCNPKHLKAGTHTENMKTRKSKLSADNIAEIRDSALNQYELALLYGVNQSTISRIKRHKRFYKQYD